MSIYRNSQTYLLGFRNEIYFDLPNLATIHGVYMLEDKAAPLVRVKFVDGMGIFHYYLDAEFVEKTSIGGNISYVLFRCDDGLKTYNTINMGSMCLQMQMSGRTNEALKILVDMSRDFGDAIQKV